MSHDHSRSAVSQTHSCVCTAASNVSVNHHMQPINSGTIINPVCAVLCETISERCSNLHSEGNHFPVHRTKHLVFLCPKCVFYWCPLSVWALTTDTVIIYCLNNISCFENIFYMSWHLWTINFHFYKLFILCRTSQSPR